MTTQTINGFGQIYSRIRGGWESDIRLHQDTIRLVGDSVPKRKVLDIGVGHGAFTYKLLERHPAELWVTDYDPAHIEHTMRALDAVNTNGTVRKPLRLDLCSDLQELGEERFDLIVCISVLMHLPPEESAKAIHKLAERLASGGLLVVGVIARSVAERCFIPAPSKGEHIFYPALSRLPANPTEADIDADPADLSSLREFYPPDEHYLQSCIATGLEVEEHHAIAGEECMLDRRGRPCVYRPIAEQRLPLWKLWTIRNHG